MFTVQPLPRYPVVAGAIGIVPVIQYRDIWHVIDDDDPHLNIYATCTNPDIAHRIATLLEQYGVSDVPDHVDVNP